MKLKKRLAAVAEKVPCGVSLADIGTDHAYLPIYLVQSGLISTAIAVEVHRGPYLTARETINALALQDKISLRFGDGLSVVRPGEADTVVMAGMGAKTIIEILTINPATTQTIRRLILQPMTASELLRHWLVNHGWYIKDEALVEEDRLYEIIVAEQGTSPELEDVFYEIGPILWVEKHSLLKKHIIKLIEGYQKILFNLTLSTIPEKEKYELLKNKMERLEAMLRCL